MLDIETITGIAGTPYARRSPLALNSSYSQSALPPQAISPQSSGASAGAPRTTRTMNHSSNGSRPSRARRTLRCPKSSRPRMARTKDHGRLRLQLDLTSNFRRLACAGSRYFLPREMKVRLSNPPPGHERTCRSHPNLFHECTGANCKGGVFVPEGPASSPFVTAVGGTTPATGFPEPGSETAVGLSSGGFSDYWPMPGWQTSAVTTYLRSATGLPPSTRKYNTSGRAYPDIAAQVRVQTLTG